MDLEINSLEELYQRLKPALLTKKNEMHREGFGYIVEADIWNYLKEVKWKKSKDLSLYQMVDDVLNTDNTLIDGYFKDKLNSNERTIYFNDEN